MVKLLDHNARIRAIPVKRRSTPSSVKSIQQMKKTLLRHFVCGQRNVEQRMKYTEVLCFLQSMKGDRLATFGFGDKVLAAKVQRRQDRVQAEAVRLEKVRNEGTATTTSVDATSDNMTGEKHV